MKSQLSVATNPTLLEKKIIEAEETIGLAEGFLEYIYNLFPRMDSCQEIQTCDAMVFGTIIGGVLANEVRHIFPDAFIVEVFSTDRRVLGRWETGNRPPEERDRVVFVNKIITHLQTVAKNKRGFIESIKKKK